MRKTLTASASAAALACTAVTSAQAAPPPPPPIYNWSGFYIGVNAGGGFGSSNPTWIANVTAAPFFLTGVEPTPKLPVGGFVGGGQAGYNFQSGSFVYGLETDLTWMDVQGSRTTSPFFIGKGSVDQVTFTSQYNWLYTARLRGGVTFFGNWLVYATGGLAIVNVQDTAMCHAANVACGDSIAPSSPQNITWSQTSTLVGSVVGGGIEMMPGQNWIVGLKALHVFLPSTTPNFITNVDTFGSGPVPKAFSFDHNLTLITFEVTYKFGGP
jgi:outer membrane immunogenic protein